MAKASEEMNLKSPPTQSSPENPHPKAHGSEWAKDKQVPEEDRVEKLIRDSGCWDQHISTVECMGDKQDWRQCQDELNNFRQCMIKNRKQFVEEAKKNSNPKK